MMRKAVKALLPALAATGLTLLGACTAEVYKDEIATFRTSVDKSVDAFDALRTELHAAVVEEHEKELANQGARVQVAGDCTAVITTRLQQDSGCMAEWSEWRAAHAEERGPAPTCIEPGVDPATGRMQFYNMAEIRAAEAEACRLGIAGENEIVRPQRLEIGEYLVNLSKLGVAMKGYARSLGDLADAKDVNELKSTVSDAKTALENLAGRIKDLTNEEVPGSAAIGPVSDLLGTALVRVLEFRRYVALRSVVGRADPIVDAAAKVLSRSSMPLMIHKLRDGGDEFSRKVEVFNDEPVGEAWKRALADARQAQAKYLALYDGHPASTFKAMADAHSALRKALDDPERQFDAMKAAISDFAAKADAAFDALQKIESDGA